MVALKAATAPGKGNPLMADDPVGIASGTEPPSDHESSLRRSYKVQLLRDKYHFLTGHNFPEMTDVDMNMREIDSIACVVG